MYATSSLKEEQQNEAAAFGFKAEDYADAHVEVWPENWRYVKLFSAMSTQWKVSAAGPTGLDYGLLFQQQFMKKMGFKRSEFKEAFDTIQLMEQEALDQIHG